MKCNKSLEQGAKVSLLYESNKVFSLLKIYGLLYLEFLSPYFTAGRQNDGSLF
jgi:hypothetical protein